MAIMFHSGCSIWFALLASFLDSCIALPSFEEYFAEMTVPNKISNNSHIASFLDYYTNLAKAPHYAVLLTGKWGIGKTFFINRYMEKFLPTQPLNAASFTSKQRKSKTSFFTRCKKKFLRPQPHGADEEKAASKIIRVSLNGIQSKDEINKLIIVELLPFLNNKGIAVAGKILSSLLKSNGGNIDDLKATDFLNIYRRDSIYVFDDLERCCMPIASSLGYINSFVENGHCKVIIIGNEEEIRDKNDVYKTIKEKVIGKTLKMMPETEEAFSYFLGHPPTSGAKEFLKSLQDSIIQIYRTSQLDNLRILQQSLNDFERLYPYLEDKHKQHEVLMKDLVTLFFALSFEIKAGHFACSNLEEWKQLNLAEAFGHSSTVQNANQVTGQEDPLEKYGSNLGEIIRYKNIFSDEALSHLLEDGFFSEKEIRQELNDLPSYFPSNTLWKNLWHWRDQEIKELDSMLEEFEKDFDRRVYTDIETILHVFGLRLHFAKNNLIDKGIPAIESECKSYVDEIIDSLPEKNWDFERSAPSSAYGLCFYGSDLEEWQRLKEYLKEKWSNKIGDEFAKSLRAQLLSNQQLTNEQILKLNESNFKEISIFGLLDTQEICNYLIKNSYGNGLALFYRVKDRLYHQGSDTKTRESDHFKSIRDYLMTTSEKNSRWVRMKIADYIQYIESEIIGKNWK